MFKITGNTPYLFKFLTNLNSFLCGKRTYKYKFFVCFIILVLIDLHMSVKQFFSRSNFNISIMVPNPKLNKLQPFQI